MKASFKLEYVNNNMNWAAKNSPRFTQLLRDMPINKLIHQTLQNNKKAIGRVLTSRAFQSDNYTGVFGFNIFDPPSVHEVTEDSQIKIDYKIDYTHSNSKGSTGVHVWFVLECGKHYKVFQPERFGEGRTYFIKVKDNSEIVCINESDIIHA